MTEPLGASAVGSPHLCAFFPTYRSDQARSRKRAGPASETAAFSSFWKNFCSQKALGPVDEVRSRWHRSQGQSGGFKMPA